MNAGLPNILTSEQSAIWNWLIFKNCWIQRLSSNLFEKQHADCTFEILKRDETQRSSNNLSSSGHYNLPLSVGLWQLWELFILLELGQKKCNASY